MLKAPVGFSGVCQGTRWSHLTQLGQTLPDPQPRLLPCLLGGGGVGGAGGGVSLPHPHPTCVPSYVQALTPPGGKKRPESLRL